MLPDNRKNFILLCLFGVLVSLTLARLALLPPARADSPQTFTLTLKVGDDLYLFGPGRVRPDRDPERILEEAVRRDGRGRITAVFPLSFGYEMPNLEDMLEEIAKNYRVEPLPAEVEFFPDREPMFVCRPGKPGKRLDTEAVMAEFEAALKSRTSAVAEGKIVDDPGPLSEEKVRRSFFLRSSFSTDLSSSTADRRHNVRLALSRFHGKMLYPGEQLSFNRTTGPRTEENGFKKARIISGGQYAEGVGGGVCQSSTTLYNALLLGDVQVDESHPHSLAVGYVPPSFDAMVNFYTSDLTFTNDTGNLLYFRSVCKGNSAGVEIWGEPLPYEIRRRSVTLKTTDAPEAEIRPAQTEEEKALVAFTDEVVILSPSRGGLESESWLDYYQSGKKLRSRRIRRDRYAPYRGYGVRGLLPRPSENPEPGLDETSSGLSPLRESDHVPGAVRGPNGPFGLSPLQKSGFSLLRQPSFTAAFPLHGRGTDGGAELPRKKSRPTCLLQRGRPEKSAPPSSFPLPLDPDAPPASL